MISIAEFAKNRCANIEDERLRLFVRQAIYEAYDLGHNEALELVEAELRNNPEPESMKIGVETVTLYKISVILDKLKSGGA